MTDLSDRFERLGLSQYLGRFIEEGFDTWETVLDITESDLTQLNVKLGHRRKLQRAIAEARGQPPDRALNTDQNKSSNDHATRSDDSGAEPRDHGIRGSGGSTLGTPSSNAGTKRKYRRHPKPDTHAPERPPSAYVIFSNQVREDLKGQDLSFTEIAKIVGERWQVLPADVRETCEQQANLAKEKYYSELSEYKKTPEYTQYQEYLIDFKAKHGAPRTEGKRSKLETEASTMSLPTVGTESPSLERAPTSRSAPILSAGVTRSSGSSPPSAGALETHSGFRRPSSASPALHSESLQSPLRQDPYSPGTSSPGSTTVLMSKDYRGPGKITQQDPRPRDSAYPNSISPPGGPYSAYRPVDNWSETGGGPPPPYYTALPRRESRGSPHPPPLVHADSTVSSTDSVPSVSMPHTSSLLPILDMPKGRTLPQPITGGGLRTSPLDPAPRALPVGNSHSILPPIAPIRGPDNQQASSWPALLRATELAREADMKDVGPGRRKGRPESGEVP